MRLTATNAEELRRRRMLMPTVPDRAFNGEL